MDGDAPRLIGLLLAGAVALMSLRGHLADTPRGQLIFRVIFVLFLTVIAFAAVALLRRGASITPDPGSPTTVAALRSSAATWSLAK